MPKPKDQKDWDNLLSPHKRIEKAVDVYLNYVEDENHGIKEKNLLALLTPIGIDLRTVDKTLIDRLDALGGRRGDAAHSSCSKALQVGVDPSDELTEIQAVLSGLVSLDTTLDDLLASSLTTNNQQTTYLTVPKRTAAAVRLELADLPGHVSFHEFDEMEGDVAFAITNPVSYEVLLGYGSRLSDLATKKRGKRELAEKFKA